MFGVCGMTNNLDSYKKYLPYENESLCEIDSDQKEGGGWGIRKIEIRLCALGYAFKSKALNCGLHP